MKRSPRLSIVKLKGDLKANGSGRAFAFALESACSLQQVDRSKFEIRLFVTDMHPPGVPELGALTMDSDVSIGAFAHVTLRRHFAAMLQREPGTCLGGRYQRTSSDTGFNPPAVGGNANVPRIPPGTSGSVSAYNQMGC